MSKYGLRINNCGKKSSSQHSIIISISYKRKILLKKNSNFDYEENKVVNGLPVPYTSICP